MSNNNLITVDLLDQHHKEIKKIFALKTGLNAKQDTLIAGSNITIADDGKTISATITSDVTKSYVDTELAKKQNTLTAGDNISIAENVISANIDVTKSYVDGKVTELSGENTTLQGKISELERSNNLLWKLNRGQTYDFETDTTECYSKAIPSGAIAMDLKSVGGKSIVFNQLVNSITEQTIEGINFKPNANGSITVSGTFSARPRLILNNVTLIKNHKYYMSCYGYSKITFHTKSWALKCGADGNCNNVLKQSSDDNNIQELYITILTDSASVGDTINETIYPRLFDLTQMFGAGNEPTTVAEFEAMFPNDYYAYNEGTLVTYSAENMNIKGKNIFNHNGYHYGNLNSNGDLQLTEDSGNYRPDLLLCEFSVIGGKTVKFSANAELVNRWHKVYFYDSNNVLLSGTQTDNITPSLSVPANAVKCRTVCISKANASAGGFDVSNFEQYKLQAEYGTSATNYVPHITDTNVVFPTEYTPKSAGSAYDYYEQASQEDMLTPKYWWWSASGTCLGESATEIEGATSHTSYRFVKRIGSVDLGTLNYSYVSSKQGFVCSNSPSDTVANANCLCVKYVMSKNSSWAGDMTCGFNEAKTLWIENHSYASASDFKSAMNGVILYYELAEPQYFPVTTDISSIEVETGGTITFVGNNANYHIPIPNTEEYLLKLDEVQ